MSWSTVIGRFLFSVALLVDCKSNKKCKQSVRWEGAERAGCAVELEFLPSALHHSRLHELNVAVHLVCMGSAWGDGKAIISESMSLMFGRQQIHAPSVCLRFVSGCLFIYIYNIFIFDATCTVLSAVSKLVEQVIKTLTRDRKTPQLTTHGTKHTPYSSLHTQAHHTSIAENTAAQMVESLTCVLRI